MTNPAVSLPAEIANLLPRSGQWQAGTRLDGWMFRIMKNAWIDEVRGRSRSGRVFAPEEAGKHVGDDSAESHQQRMAIRQAISMLSDVHRVVDGLVRAREALQGLLSDQARTVS